MNMDCSSKVAFKNELFRKLLHFPALFFIFLGKQHPKISIGLLIVLIGIYITEYLLRTSYQTNTPYLSDIILKLHRSSRFDFGPFFLALSLIILLLFFPFLSALCGILLIVLSDSAAAFTGLKFGNNKIFYSPKKSYLGSLAFFTSGFFCLVFLIGIIPALLLSLLGCFLESLPFEQIDNLLVPLGVALCHRLFFYQV